MASQVLMPDDDGDLSEKMKILLANKASLERELDIIEKEKGINCRRWPIFKN